MNVVVVGGGGGGGAVRVDDGPGWVCEGSTVGVVGNGVCSGLFQTAVGDKLLIMDGEGLTVAVDPAAAAAAAAAFMDASIWGSEIVVNSSHGNEGSRAVGAGANSAMLLPSILVSFSVCGSLSVCRCGCGRGCGCVAHCHIKGTKTNQQMET